LKALSNEILSAGISLEIKVCPFTVRLGVGDSADVESTRKKVTPSVAKIVTATVLITLRASSTVRNAGVLACNRTD
jgi:hypothetical protein